MNIVRHYMHTIRPHYDAFIAAEEAHDEINSSELIQTRTRCEKLVIFENDPLCKH